MYIIDDNMNDVFIFLFYQNIGDMDMDFGDTRKESIEGSDAMSLKGTKIHNIKMSKRLYLITNQKRMLIYMLSHKVFFNIIINLIFVILSFVFN